MQSYITQTLTEKTNMMTENSILIVAVLLFVKHFIIDFLMQTKYQYSNKGTYGHPGGLLHSALHGFATAIIFSYFTLFAGLLAAIDAVIHYHVDYAKVNLNNKLGYGPTTHEKFWWLLGLDQLLHALTYIGLIYLALRLT